MTSVSGQRVLVVGAGVVGSAIALDLARQGADVRLADPGAGPNASSVAAGMLAPVMETLLDPASAGHLDLLRGARDRWPAFAESLPIQIHRCGAALFTSDQEEYARYHDRLGALDVQADALGELQVAKLTPGLSAPGPALFTSEDWRVDAPQALAALIDGVRRHGGAIVQARLVALDGRHAWLSDGSQLDVDAVVLATGLPPAGSQVDIPELSVLAPIKGQLVRFSGAGPDRGPILRASGGYAVPGAEGLVVGATMEPGVSDLEPDGEVADRFADLGRRLFPHLAAREARTFVGVRASTPDGLPMVGASSAEGVHLALGARRNGWLLAPMIAEVLRDSLAAGAKDPRFDPLRFVSSG